MMNSKRGFKRITVVLAVIIALLSATLSILIVIDKRESAKGFLYWREENFMHNYSFLPDDRERTLTKEDAGEDLIISKYRRVHPHIGTTDTEIRSMYNMDIREIHELESGFWVKLSKSSFVAMCVAAGLAGGLTGLSSAWFILWFGGLATYKLIMWLILGFCDDVNNKQVESIETR